MLVLLNVTGIALLTLLINAPTMAPLLKRLGMTQEKDSDRETRSDLEHRVQEFAWRKYEQLIETSRAPRDMFWKRQIIRACSFMTDHEKGKRVLDQLNTLDRLDPKKMSPDGGLAAEAAKIKQDADAATLEAEMSVPSQQKPSQPKRRASAANLSDKTAAHITNLNEASHKERLKQVRKIFLKLVRQSYTEMVEDGVVPARSTLAFSLTNSVDTASDYLQLPLYDWCAIQPALAYSWSVLMSLRLLRWFRDPMAKETAATRWSGLRIYMNEEGKGSARDMEESAPRCGRCSWFRFIIERVLLSHVAARKPIRSRAYLLTCFITAHLEVQEELSWMFGKEEDSMHAEAAQVSAESELAVTQAEAYLGELGTVGRSDTQKLFSSVIDRVRAEQMATMMLHQVEIYIKMFIERGVKEAEELLKKVGDDQLNTAAALNTDVEAPPGKTHAATVMGMVHTGHQINLIQQKYDRQANALFLATKAKTFSVKYTPEEAPDDAIVELSRRNKSGELRVSRCTHATEHKVRSRWSLMAEGPGADGGKFMV